MVVCNSNPPVDAGGGTMMGVEERWYLGQECLPLYEKSVAFTVDIRWILTRLPDSRQIVLHHSIVTNHAISLHCWQAGPLSHSQQLGIVVESVKGSKVMPAPFPNHDAWYPGTFPDGWSQCPCNSTKIRWRSKSLRRFTRFVQPFEEVIKIKKCIRFETNWVIAPKLLIVSEKDWSMARKLSSP